MAEACVKLISIAALLATAVAATSPKTGRSPKTAGGKTYMPQPVPVLAIADLERVREASLTTYQANHPSEDLPSARDFGVIRSLELEDNPYVLPAVLVRVKKLYAIYSLSESRFLLDFWLQGHEVEVCTLPPGPNGSHGFRPFRIRTPRGQEAFVFDPKDWSYKPGVAEY